MDQGADGLAAECVGKVAVGAEIEDDDGDVVVHAQAEGGGIHDAESLGKAFLEGDCLVAHGIRVVAGVAVIDTIHLGGLEDHIRSHFTGTKGGGGIGGEEWIAGAGGEDDDLAFVKLALGLAADEGFRDVFHFDGGLDDTADSMMLEGSFEGEGIHDRGEHSDVIGGGAIHTPGGGAGTAPEIPAADDDAELEAAFHSFADFEGDAVNDLWRDVVAGAWATKGFSAEFENGTFEGTGIFRAVWHRGLELADESGKRPCLKRQNTESIQHAAFYGDFLKS